MIPLSAPAQLFDSGMEKKILEVLRSGRYIQGKETEDFEKEFSKFCGTKSGAAVSSGTAALHLALMGLGIKPGNEVITTAQTFIATANAIVHAGGRPVLVDIEKDTHNLDPCKIEERITRKTRGIVPVHLYGHPADMDPIIEVAEKHGLFVIEDACQAHGAEYRGRKVGSIGHAAAFSFFPSKVITVFGDGGMVTTNDSDVAEKVRMLRNQGRTRGKKYEHDAIGYNYRMGEASAALGRMALKHLPEWIERRRKIAATYNRLLMDLVAIPVEKDYARAVYYVYTVMAERRDALREHLSRRGIESGVYYPVPVSLQPAYRKYGYPHFPVAEDVAGKILSLPMHPFLKKEETERVADAVEEFCRRTHR